MARVEIDEVLIQRDGSGLMRAVPGASVRVYLRGTTVDAAVYAAETGGTTVSNPLTADVNGELTGWVTAGSYDLEITYGGTTYPVKAWEAARGDSVGGGALPNLFLNAADYATLQDAIDAIPSTGAELFIPRGKRSENATMTGKDHVTITGEGSSTVIHNATAATHALEITDCDDLTIRDLRVQGTSGTLDGLHLERCRRASVGTIYSGGTGRYGIYAQECIGITVDPCYCGPDTPGPYPTGVTPMLGALVLDWDGVNGDSGCNGLRVRGGDYVPGKANSDWAVRIVKAEVGVIDSPIAELAAGGIFLDRCAGLLVNGYYGEANPSDVEWVTGQATVTNGSVTATGIGTLWDTDDPQGQKPAMPGKFLVVIGGGVLQKDNLVFSGTVSGGTYTINVGGQITSPIAYNANAAAVKTAIEALSNVASGDITVTGGPGPTNMVITYGGSLAFRSLFSAADPTNLTGAGHDVGTSQNTLPVVGSDVHWKRVAAIVSDTQLTLEEPWSASTFTAQAHFLTGVDLLMEGCLDCEIYGARGGGAIALEDSSRNIINGRTERLLLDEDSNYNQGRIITNTAGGTNPDRVVDAGTSNRLRVFNINSDLPTRDDVESDVVGGGLVARSPDGARWRLTPSNAGASVWTAL